MATLAEIRARYPQYGDLSDQQLADSLYSKFYSDMDRAAFDQKVGLTAAPPEGMKPGSSEYATWAMEQARAGNKLPTVGNHDTGWEERNLTDDGQGGTRVKMNSLGDKLTAAAGSYIEGAPIIGPAWLDATTKVASWLRNDGTTAEDMKANLKNLQQDNPITSGAAGVGSSILNLAPLASTQLGGRLLGTVGTTVQRLIAGGLSSAALSGADTAARGGDLGEIATNSAVGAGLGLLFPAAGGVKNYLGNKAAQRAATTAAIKDAPNVSELKAAASAMFENSRAANAGVNATAFRDFAAKLVDKAMKADIDPDLDGQAMAAYQRMVQMVNEAQASGGVSLSRLHNLRQLAQDVVIEAKKPRTKNFANDIVDGLDNLIENLKPGQMTGGGKQAANDLLNGISTWSRAKKLALIEEAITQAEFQPSGVTNGLRLKFQALLRNPKTRGLFSEAELAEIKRVANGGVVDNIARLVGKFGFGLGNNGNNVVGGSIGLAFGGIPGMVAGAGARKVAEKMTEAAAERAAKVVATENLPKLTPKALPNGIIPPALLPLETTKKRQPVEITIGTRGL